MRLVQSVCLSLLAVLLTAGNAVADPALEGGDTITVYTFDDLSPLFLCDPLYLMGQTTSGLYGDLVFSSNEMAVCTTQNGTPGLVPSAFAFERLEVRVGLTVPASAVSIEAYLFDYGEPPALIAYDSTGTVIGQAEAPADGAIRVLETLEVQATDTPIAEIGLLMPQYVVYLDNLTVTYGTVGQDEEPVPDVEPQDVPDEEPQAVDPVSVDECYKGGWIPFDFRNQGQCVTFVRTGRDSR